MRNHFKVVFTKKLLRRVRPMRWCIVLENDNPSNIMVPADPDKVLMLMFATLDKANPDTENIRGLNLAAVKHTTVQVTRLLL
jgi:hypothetical protein